MKKCFNRFHPISHSRLWELQILVVAVPILIFAGIALGVQEKNQKLKEKVQHYEETNIGEYSNTKYQKAKQELSNYSVIKVNSSTIYFLSRRNICFEKKSSLSAKK